MDTDFGALQSALQSEYDHETTVLSQAAHAPLPPLSNIFTANQKLISSIPDEGLGLKRITEHLIEDVTPGLNGGSLSASYYGFVTGGVTPAARIAEKLTTLYDQNVAAHLPEQTIASVVEDRALCMLIDLLGFNVVDFPLRTLTTGATASNVLGLAAGRNSVIRRRSKSTGDSPSLDIDALGLLEACRQVGIEGWQILTCCGHSSLAKAANIVGLGSASVVDVSCTDKPVEFDVTKLVDRLRQHKLGSIVVVSCGEVNTGHFSTHGEDEMRKLRELCDSNGAWLHVDGAFGIFARCLRNSSSEFDYVASGAAGVDLADSIGGDGHKMLNVPYDCGFFFSRHKEQQVQVFRNPHAAYLSVDHHNIMSSLDIGIENSRRFRGLPLYASLAAYGRRGYKDMIERQVRLSRRIARWIRDSPGYTLLPRSTDPDRETLMIVMFRAQDSTLNNELVKRVNATRRIYVSGSSWQGEVACRIAVANWQADEDAQCQLVIDVLEKIL